MNDKLFLTIISLLFLGLVYPFYRLIRRAQEEIYVWKNRKNRNPAASRLLWKIAYSKGK